MVFLPRENRLLNTKTGIDFSTRFDTQVFIFNGEGGT
jgi:hypothetical protein